MNTKVCNKCKEEKPLTEFHKDSSRKDGMKTHCKVCRKRYNQENREYRLEYNRQWRKKNPEYDKQYHKKNREKRLEYIKQWRQENPEHHKQYYKENREKRLEYKKQYHKENPEKMAVWTAKRRALKRDSIPDVISNRPEEKERLVQIYKLRDLLAEATGIEHHVDHIWPLSKGGPHWSGNLQVITAEENLSKGDKLCKETARVIQESLDEHYSPRQ